jgi:hypothetical protein
MYRDTFVCPHCNTPCPLTEQNHSSQSQRAPLNLTGFGDQPRTGLNQFNLLTRLYTCTNQACGLSSIVFEVRTDYTEPRGNSLSEEPTMIRGRLIKTLQLVPPPKAKTRQWPAMVPAVVKQDYDEAYLIRDISPRASAALARRCLQGMIRDRYGVSLKTLNNEIQALNGKVDDQRWKAIDSLREIGNFAAHPEKDINVIVDINADQVAALLRFVERLIEDWYINRDVKDTIEHAIIQMADEMKASQKK